jgi:hypothetical protein
MCQASWSLINDPKPNYFASTTYRYLLNFWGKMQIKVSKIMAITGCQEKHVNIEHVQRRSLMNTFERWQCGPSQII